MRNAKNGGNESAARGITPCARGDSLLKILSSARKFADDLVRNHAAFFAGFSFHVFAITFLGGEVI
jgi:hypothetical protein